MRGHPWLVCGLSGEELGGEEEKLLRELQPGGVILFARNVQSPDQLQNLVAQLRSLPWSPFVAVDLEGGKVNRLRSLVGELPSAAEVAQVGAGAARALGEACGALCAALGVTVDLAPVVDVAGPQSFLGQEGRCFGAQVPQVVELAGAFLQGLEAYGVQGCLKHYPGLGSGEVDSHQQLPLLHEEVRQHRQAFVALASRQRAVMVAHALAPSLGEALAPASLSPRLVGGIPETSGPILADDLEMGALQAWGSLAERAAAALLAGCHYVLLCNALDARWPVAVQVALWAQEDQLLARAVARRAPGGFGQGPLRPTSWEEALAKVDQLRQLVWGKA